MGLYIQSLDNIPPDAERDYFIYLLDYGWKEPLGEALMKNYDKMAEMAERNNAVVIRSNNRVHFEDQVLSWHHINGEDAENILPAILITNRNPHAFRERATISNKGKIEKDLKLILIPLKKFCTNTSQVVELIKRLFNEIKAGKELSNFSVGKKTRRGGKSLADSLILEPSNGSKEITMTDVISYLKNFDIICDYSVNMPQLQTETVIEEIPSGNNIIGIDQIDKKATLTTLISNNDEYERILKDYYKKIQTVSIFLSKEEFIKQEIARIKENFIQPVKVQLTNGRMLEHFNYSVYVKCAYEWLSMGQDWALYQIISNAEKNYLQNRYLAAGFNEKDFSEAIIRNLSSGVAYLLYEKFLKEELQVTNGSVNEKGIKEVSVSTDMRISKTVHPIHFEDFSGQQFERLVFAFVTKQKNWDTIQWLGQTGKDEGRDIWGEIGSDTYCYQCANYRQLVLRKVSIDIDKLVNNGNTIPHHFIVVAGGQVTTTVRNKIVEYAIRSGIKYAEVWSGVEFEEKLRNATPELLERFVKGESFPEAPSQLMQITKLSQAQTDQDIINLIIECFDRPAFITRFSREANMPDFEKAITDTIEVLNTGMHRLRDGTVIGRIPSRHRITDTSLKNTLAEITKLVVNLRNKYTELVRNKEIQPCGCTNVSCTTYMLSDKASIQMDKIRQEIFEKFKTISPGIHLKLD